MAKHPILFGVILFTAGGIVGGTAVHFHASGKLKLFTSKKVELVKKA